MTTETRLAVQDAYYYCEAVAGENGDLSAQEAVRRLRALPLPEWARNVVAAVATLDLRRLPRRENLCASTDARRSARAAMVALQDAAREKGIDACTGTLLPAAEAPAAPAAVVLAVHPRAALIAACKCLLDSAADAAKAGEFADWNREVRRGWYGDGWAQLMAVCPADVRARAEAALRRIETAAK